MKRLTRVTSKIVLLNSQQLNTIFKNSTEHLRLVMELAVNTGLRLNELRALKFSDFDLKNSILHVAVENSKTKKHDRFIPLNYKAKAAVKMLKKDKKEIDFITDLTDHAFKTHCYRLSRKIGFRFSFHSLRHTFITAFYNASLDPYMTASVSGHKSINTTMIYVHQSGTAAKSVVDRMSFDFDLKTPFDFSRIKRTY